jgi:hypothetical protein
MTRKKPRTSTEMPATSSEALCISRRRATASIETRSIMYPSSKRPAVRVQS